MPRYRNQTPIGYRKREYCIDTIAFVQARFVVMLRICSKIKWNTAH